MDSIETDADAAPPDSDHERHESRGRARILTWRRLVAYAFAAATLILVYVDRKHHADWIEPWGLWAGAALAVVGEWLRVWGCGHLRKNQDVITSGPYAHVRNPLYLGTLLIIVGMCVAAGTRIIVYGLLPLGLIAFFAYYTPKKERVESDRLRRRFGARFDVYHDAVNGYLPRLTRWSGASNERWSASLVVENTELPTVLFVALGLAVVIAVRVLEP
jgi:protein-S-isoprenylcysteine O-methyltransferase Ste14